MAEELTRGQKIMVYVTKMQKYVDDNQGKSFSEIESYCKEKYGQFHSKYPTIFEKCLTKISVNDMNMLKDMLARSDMIDQKKTTEYDESVKIGKLLAKQYLDPIVKKIEKK